MDLTAPLTPTWIGSPNFRPGRGSSHPEAVVVHVIEGSLVACDSWFRNPVAQVSAHYAVGQHGQVHQYVHEEDTAWHAGRVQGSDWGFLKVGVNPNAYTIGIEHEAGADEPWTDMQYERSARLVAEICVRWQIPIDSLHIVGHHRIYAPKSCPGKGDVDRIVRVARWRAGGVLGGEAGP